MDQTEQIIFSVAYVMHKCLSNLIYKAKCQMWYLILNYRNFQLTVLKLLVMKLLAGQNEWNWTQHNS